MPITDPTCNGPRGLGSLPLWTGVALIACVIFLALPELDLNIARALFVGDSHFIAQGRVGNFGRVIGYVIPFVVLAAYVFCWLARRLRWPTPFSPNGRDVLFLALAMLIGPGLVVNLGMKDHLHRPSQSLEVFLGQSDFSALHVSVQERGIVRHRSRG